MRHTYKTLIAAFMAASVLAGCQNEDPIKEVVEGLPVSLSFNVEVPNMDDIVITRATDEQETRIEKMAILFYNAKLENSKPIVVKVDDLGAPTQEKTSTNWLYTINLDEEQLDGVYSGEWYMYPIANYDKYTVVDLNDLAGKTLKEFKEYTITASGRDITTSAVTMSGYYGSNKSTHTITLQPGDNTFDEVFHLRRIVSKNIFKFVNGSGVTFTPQKYSIYNYSTSSTLLERDELNEYAGVYTGTDGEGFTNFESLPITNTDGSFSFYMPENVQIPNAKDSWTYADREKRLASDYNTFEYAPANATYVVVEGTYSGPGESGKEATGNVKYTIHLGNFGDSKGTGNFDNFTVKRNAKYTYTVTINGVNSIIVEAKSETGEEPNPGAEGQIVGPDPHVTVNLDAHYENVLLSFSFDISSFSISATTPDESGNMQSFIDASNNKSEHLDAVSWVKFGKPASTTTFANYPQNNDVVDIYTLIEEITDAKKNGTTPTHCLIYNNTVYVQAFVDEYFYDDRDYSTFVNKGDRSLSFTIGTASISKDEHSSYIEGEGFTLQQKSIKTFYADNVSNPFGYETVEETPNAPFGAMGVADTFSGNDYQNGRNDTWSNISNASKVWNTILNISENGHIGNAEVASSSVMQSDYTSPLYQCLSRNRDLNGDGTITKDEIKWYVPSFRQYIYTWCGMKALSNDISFTSTDIYASSSNAGYRIWWAKEGVAIGSYSAGGTYNGTTYQPQSPSVRCVRNLGESIDDDFSKISSFKEDTRVVTITGLKNEALRTNGQSGEYPEHINTDAASTLPKAFKIAKNNLETEVEVSGEATISITTNYSTYQAANPVSNLIDGSESTYWWASEAQARGKYVLLTFSVPVKVASVRVYSIHSSDYPQNQTLQISADGQNWTDIGTVNSSNVTVTNSASPDLAAQYVRLYQNNNSSNWLYLNEITVNYTTISGQTITKNTFSYNELMSGDWCEKYYSEEGDADKGKWRIPNEKELYFIQLYCSGDFNLMTTNGDGGDLVGAKTKYYRGSTSAEYMIYYLRNDASAKTPIITTGETVGLAYNFKLRCVRDATPEAKSYDSSYGDGGTGFGL